MNEKLGNVSALRLLARAPDPDYLEEWAELIRKPIPSRAEKKEKSVVIFRLGEEWMAISTSIFFRVDPFRKIHPIPHYSRKSVLGLINLAGLLAPCMNLHHILQVPALKKHDKEESALKRMFAIQKETEKWTFPVDEVFGIYFFDVDTLANVPVTVVKSSANYLKGVFRWSEKNVGYLDDELIFNAFKRALQ